MCSGGAVPLYAGDVSADTGKLALRDRNHASVVWYSLCNEDGCGPGTLLNNDTALGCQQAIHAVDKTRAITGNVAWQYSAGHNGSAVDPHTPLSNMLDVMGMSHQGTKQVNSWHDAEPNKLVVMTECCSCETQRGEDADLLAERPQEVAAWDSNENSACVKAKTQVSDAPEWVGGTFVWTLHDYYGEPAKSNKWPHISSSFGSFDLSGFAKAPAWWYRSWWLAGPMNNTANGAVGGARHAEDAGRAPLSALDTMGAGDTTVFCRIVESWQPGPSLNTSASRTPTAAATSATAPPSNRMLHVYTNAAYVRILVNGEARNGAVPVAAFGSASFTNVPYAPGNVTAECAATPSGPALATHTKHSWGAAASIILSLDAPHATTGTGSALYLDGHGIFVPIISQFETPFSVP